MVISKAAKVEVEIGKTKDKIAELQNRLRELEIKKTEIENSEIVGVVRNMNIPLDELATLLQSIKNGGALPAPTSGHIVQKSESVEETEVTDND